MLEREHTEMWTMVILVWHYGFRFILSEPVF